MKWGFDIDGVICREPVVRSRDACLDAERSGLNIPSDSHEVFLVSSRLEKMRGETERWLAENGVEYERLVLYDGEGFEDMSEEEIDEMQGEFKADVISRLGLEAFVEDRHDVRKQLRNRCPGCVVLSPSEACKAWRFST